MNRLLALTVVSFVAGALHAADISADSVRGAEVFEQQGCVDCHARNGRAAAIGPDAASIADRGFTPASMAATMWNHAPAMWREMRLRSVAPPALDEQQAANLFAFFYAVRFFEEPGDAGRGKSLFTSRQCASCHGVANSKSGEPGNARAVRQWTDPDDPLALVETMWNHSTAMRADMRSREVALPQLSGQDLADLLVYVRSVQGLPRRRGVFHTGDPAEGKVLFESKTCARCHNSATGFFSTSLRNETLTDIAADMWNHGRDMGLPIQTFEAGQMREIAAYIWWRRLSEPDPGSRSGKNVFIAKKCGVCHDDPASATPSLTKGGGFSGIEMVSVLTRHGPEMLDRMREKHLTWPRFSEREMAHLIAYLNVRRERNGR